MNFTLMYNESLTDNEILNNYMLINNRDIDIDLDLDADADACVGVDIDANSLEIKTVEIDLIQSNYKTKNLLHSTDKSFYKHTTAENHILNVNDNVENCYICYLNLRYY